MTSLLRFHQAQTGNYSGYETALREIRAGKKASHWMWYIFPQLRGLGKSDTAQFYGLTDLEEARGYAADPVLGARLEEISRAMLEQPDPSAWSVLGHTDAMKLCSCMTLFEIADPDRNVYGQVLDRFYQGRRDARTLKLLGLL